MYWNSLMDIQEGIASRSAAAITFLLLVDFLGKGS
jgi:hypothetical protein